MAEYFNGWKFDDYAKIINKENQLVLWNENVKYSLYFQSRYHWQTPELEGYRIVCNRSVWEDDGNFQVSHGLGKFVTIVEEAGNRRSIKKLAALTKELTSEILEKAFQNVEVFTAGGIVLAD